MTRSARRERIHKYNYMNTHRRAAREESGLLLLLRPLNSQSLAMDKLDMSLDDMAKTSGGGKGKGKGKGGAGGKAVGGRGAGKAARASAAPYVKPGKGKGKGKGAPVSYINVSTESCAGT